MQELQHVPIERQFEYWHVVCSRVVDKWRLTEAEHTSVYCYYGWDGPYAAQVVRGTSLDDAIRLQNKVLTHMGRADHVDYARSRRVPGARSS